MIKSNNVSVDKKTPFKSIMAIKTAEFMKKLKPFQKLFPSNVEKNNLSINNTNPRLMTDSKNIPINVSTETNSQGLIDVADINNDQLKVLQDLRNISVQTLKVLAKNNEQSTFIPTMTPTRNKPSNNKNNNSNNQHRLNVNRGDYGSSPYALA